MVESRVSIKELALGLTEPQRLAKLGWNHGGGVVHSAHRLAHLAVYQVVNSGESHWVAICRTSATRAVSAARPTRSGVEGRLLNAPGNFVFAAWDFGSQVDKALYVVELHPVQGQGAGKLCYI